MPAVVVSILALVAAALLALVLGAGCSDTFHPEGNAVGSSPPGGYGATPGGVQDMQIARQLVAAGQVPPAAALRVEGMFSEHDLPLDGGDCASTLCIGGAPGWEDDSGWLQIGLSSDIDPGTFVRPASAIVLLVDISGSMGWSYGQYGVPAAVARALLLSMIEAFDAGDRIGIATFATTAALVQTFVPGDQHDLLAGHVAAMTDAGTTNMEAGLRLAQEMFQGIELDVEERRVILMTDANPNTGATAPGAFMSIAAGLAADGIGLTVIGTGIGLDSTVMQAMLDLEGGNGFSVVAAEDVDAFLEDQWPWMVCPIAHALSLAIAPTGGFEVSGGYGFPGDEAGLEVASVFLSKRRGALLVRLAGGELTTLGAEIDLDYRTPDGATHQQHLTLAVPAGAAPDSAGRYFAAYSTRKATALALLVDGMRSAAEVYTAAPEAAIALMQAARDRFDSDADALLAQGQGDAADIERERALAAAMLTLMREGAPQGTLYGQLP
ncbi:MAG: vWA domain-containing protein [Candidatus Eiseniibacteriota bacterium]